MPIPVLSALIVGGIGYCGAVLYRTGVEPGRSIVLTVLGIPAAIIVGYVLWTLVCFGFPIEWRLSSPRWDAWLCARGSHRCVTCSRGCCAICVRCKAGAP
jgi:hypothetical protein